jgi:hypothetical protein
LRAGSVGACAIAKQHGVWVGHGMARYFFDIKP